MKEPCQTTIMQKIDREKLTVERMIRLYCRGKEGNQELCPRCQSLLTYAHKRLDHCPFGNGKSSCRSCPIHCYRPDMRQHMRSVMRYSGPRMLLHHPWETLLHMLPGKPLRKQQNKKK